jgi:hypothetical protein
MISATTTPLTKLFNYRRLAANQLRDFEDQGFLVLPSLLTPLCVERMVEECMAAWNVAKGPYKPDATWLQNALLVNIHHHSKIVRDYYFQGPLVDVAEQLIGPNVKGVTSQLTFKMRGNTKPFAWHQDNGYGELEPYNALTCLTALEDNDQETGCLWIIPRSHKNGQIKVVRTEADKQAHREIALKCDETNAIPMPLKTGDCLIFSCWLLHKSEGNYSKDRDRRVLFLRYADADAVEVYNERKPRLGRVVRGRSKFPEVDEFEKNL